MKKNYDSFEKLAHERRKAIWRENSALVFAFFFFMMLFFFIGFFAGRTSCYKILFLMGMP